MNFIIIFLLIFALNSSLICHEYKNHAFVTCQESNNLFIINLDNDKIVKTFKLGLAPAAIDIDRVNGKVFIANPDSNNVSILNLSKEEITEINANKSPLGIIADSENSLVFVSNWYDNKISVIDLNKKKF